MPDSRKHIFVNNSVSRLAVGISELDTTLQLIAGGGDNFPHPGDGEIFKITVENVLTGDMEVMNVVSVSGDLLEVERAVEFIGNPGNQIAKPFSADVNTIVSHRVTADTMASIVEASSGGGGLTLTEQVNSYEVQLADANTGIVNPLGNGANSYFIPSAAFLNFDEGTFFVFINREDTKTLTVTIEGDTVILSQDGTETTTFSIGPRGMATVIKTKNTFMTPPCEDPFFVAEWFAIGTQIS